MRKILLPKLTLVLALFAALTLPVPGAAAEVIVSPGESIQAAIDAAADGDVIIVQPGTYVENIDFKGKTITLRSTDPQDPAVVAATVIDGGGVGTVVTFRLGEGPGTLLSGFTLINGNGYGTGGAIRSSSSSPTISHCVMSGNSSTSGTVHLSYSTATIVDCVISGNTAGRGGISSYGSAVTVSGSTITGNIPSPQYSGGGGLNLANSTGTIENTIISGNTSASGGGGILLVENSSFTITDCTISDNVSTGSYAPAAGGGGGILLERSFATVTGTTISGNDSQVGGGGGVFLFDNSSIEITNSTITDNEAQSHGGGIYGNVSCTLDISDTDISGNTSGFSGGGVYLDAFCDLTMTRCTITGNATQVPGNGWGGGFSAMFATVSLSDSTISNNVSAAYAGGMYVSGTALTLSGTLFNGNTAAVDGGGLFVAGDHWAGSLTSSVTDCVFSGNTARSGAGLFLSDTAAPLRRCTVSDNTSTSTSYGHGGGGLRLLRSSSEISECSFTGNTSDQGGGVKLDNSSSTISRCDISGNSATYFGGGIHYDGFTGTVVNTTITGNAVTYPTGGGPFIYGGGGVYGRNTSPVFFNCTVADNTSESNGGGFHFSASSPTITNCIVWNVAPAEITSEYGGGDPVVTYSDVRGGFAGVGNLDRDPQFVSSAAGDYRLLDGSRCIDAGTNTGAPTEDKLGEPRPQDGDEDGTAVCDMGAYEGGFLAYVPPVAVAGDDQAVHTGDSVTLDGGASYDPDEDYPLEYAWAFVSMPQGSTAVFSNPHAAMTSFIADLPGDYEVALTVTDSLGLASEPDPVLVTTFNAPPVADAGPDQAVILVNTVIDLDGTQSWDPEGDPLTYAWLLATRPPGSAAALTDPFSATPSFVADVNGAYAIELVVSDPWDESAPDQVLVSFANLPPVADAGGNMSVMLGDTVSLDGGGSYDPNNDPLTYSWTMVSRPAGSAAALTSATAVQTSFVADRPGEYIVSLVVNDGLADSTPSNVTVTAVSSTNDIIDILQELIVIINGHDDTVFKNRNMKHALTNKINAVIGKVEQGLYSEALDKIENDILGKTDGCALSGAPDQNDWIRDCAVQGEVYPLLMEVMALLDQLIS